MSAFTFVEIMRKDQKALRIFKILLHGSKATFLVSDFHLRKPKCLNCNHNLGRELTSPLYILMPGILGRPDS